MVEAEKVEIFGCIEKHKLLIFRHAKNAEHYKIELNWNVSGTRISAVRSSRKKKGRHARARGGSTPKF